MSSRASSKQSSVDAAALAVLLALFGACDGSQAKQVAADRTPSNAAGADTPKAFTLDEAQRSRIVLHTVTLSRYRPTLEATATVMFNGDHSTQVLAPISGPVARILVTPGSRVTRGQLLATVSSPDFATAVAGYRKADAATRNSERIFKQNEQLFKNDALSRRELEQSQTDASAAAADLDAAMEGLRSLGVDSATIAAVRDGQATGLIEAGIRSPLTGTVVEKLVSPGQLLQAGATPTFTVADLSSVWVMASVFEADLAVVQAGEDVEILTEAAAKPLHGRVDYVAALVDPASKATQVRILAPNGSEVLKRDMFVRVRIHANRDRSGILLPAAAIMRDEENLPFVFVAQPNASYTRRRVTLGERSGDQYAILAGLTVGERVVSDGALFIQFAESQ